ncbi:zinc-dependent metalloprotease family protein [Luteimonas sp. RD2P54]|uniref:Zinc-dependent metalloprotease family protein n=1 Tax=Luteimonas endophytica TaxID=3042023 RepID=A0ABT6JBI0_9GAMM|nr:zinc-dependent metalloprotease family protein [Luteimonas endophytica]MDH5823543.1 zinc-dependent metalloprotease family protein [Luteimonas endophytica]
MREVRIVPLKRGGIFATIRVDDFVYQVARLSSGTQVLSKQDLSKLHQPPNDILFPELRIEPKAGARQRNEKSPDKIRLVIGFTAAAESGAGGYAALVDEVSDAIANAHTSYGSSDIDLELEIAAFARPAYTESSVHQALSDLYYVQGGMWLPHQARESEYADVIALVVEAPGDPVCGLAASLGSVKETAMFVVRRGCFASHVFAHELGHLIWADHNPEDASIPEPIIPFAHGYRREAEPGVAGWSTVMSVTQSCQSSCPRQNKWSSPVHEHNGEPRGTAQTHDNARVLIQQKSVVAGFYPDPPATQMEHTSGTPKLYTPHGRLETAHW